MKDKIKDWTLEEILTECSKHIDHNCMGCKLWLQRDDGKCRFSDSPTPQDWDLKSEFRFTEREISDAETLMRLFPACTRLYRYMSPPNTLVLEDNDSNHFGVELNPNMFQSVPPGTHIYLRDIIG
jgi:hypothetical protein